MRPPSASGAEAPAESRPMENPLVATKGPSTTSQALPSSTDLRSRWSQSILGACQKRAGSSCDRMTQELGQVAPTTSSSSASTGLSKMGRLLKAHVVGRSRAEGAMAREARPGRHRESRPWWMP